MVYFSIKDEVFENNIRRIGAEQEMCLVNTKNHKPAPICMDVIEAMGANIVVEECVKLVEKGGDWEKKNKLKMNWLALLEPSWT